MIESLSGKLIQKSIRGTFISVHLEDTHHRPQMYTHVYYIV